MLERVLPSCAWAAAHARLVTIDREALAHYADSLAPGLPQRMEHTPHHLIADLETTTAYFLLLDTRSEEHTSELQSH